MPDLKNEKGYDPNAVVVAENLYRGSSSLSIWYGMSCVLYFLMNLIFITLYILNYIGGNQLASGVGLAAVAMVVSYLFILAYQSQVTEFYIYAIRTVAKIVKDS